jgi:hypothetical protein
MTDDQNGVRATEQAAQVQMTDLGDAAGTEHA